MPFCPVCRMEYRTGVDRCPDCDAELVDELPPEGAPQWDPTEWATVEEVCSRPAAAILEGFLLEQGFPVRILDRSDTEFALCVGELGQIEVQVPVEELDRALRVLAERDEVLGDDEEEATAEETDS